MRNSLRYLIVAALAIFVAASFGSHFRGFRDGTHTPLGLYPDTDVVTGSSVNMTLYMNGVVSSNTPVSVSASNGALVVPSTVTVLSGNSSVTFTATNGLHGIKSLTGTPVTVTCTANGKATSADLTVY